jgi:hypothetical protein
MYRNAVAFFVMEIAFGFAAVRALDGSPNRTFRSTDLTTSLIAVQQRSPRAWPAHDLMAKVAGNAFRSVAPENDLFLKIDHTDSYLQTLQHASTYLGILKGKHRWSLGSFRLSFHRHNPQRLQENLPS